MFPVMTDPGHFTPDSFKTPEWTELTTRLSQSWSRHGRHRVVEQKQASFQTANKYDMETVNEDLNCLSVNMRDQRQAIAQH